MSDTDVHKEFRLNVRRLAETRIKPYAAKVDEDARIPEEALAAFRDMGLSGLGFPEELGGGNGDLMAQIIAIEEVSRVCGSSGLVMLIPWAALSPLVACGSHALKETVIPEVASGKEMASFCLTEPGGGSDLPGLKTAARREAGGWRLKGHKRFISNAGWSKWYVVLARTDQKAFGVFIVSKDDRGVSFGKPERKMGVRGSPTADVNFDDVFVSDDRVVGDPAKGYALMMETLTHTRPMVGAHALGIAQGAFDEAVRYTADRSQFSSKVSRFQMIRGMIADMSMRIEAARSLLYRTVSIADENDSRSRAFASMAKVVCSDAAMSVTTDAVQLHGGYGFIKDYPVERMMRDAKITQIWEGTNQIQRLLIAQYAYGD